MIRTNCLDCGSPIEIDNIQEGEGYFFGYDTDYYGLGFDDEKDPHNIIGYYCKKCGLRLRCKAEKIGWERIRVPTTPQFTMTFDGKT